MKRDDILNRLTLVRSNDRPRRSVWPGVAACVIVLNGCAVGDYRMPYSDGTVVLVTADALSHNSPEAYMYDMVAQLVNNQPAAIVAAAPGIVRFVEEDNIEPTDDNNYVWIEHPQYEQACNQGVCSEWTIYAHFAQNSVLVEEGDTVNAGQYLGIESDVGFATSRHLHWNVALLPAGTQPTYNGYYLDYVKESGVQPELIPIVCHGSGETVLWDGVDYTAAGCTSPVVIAAESRTAPLENLVRHRLKQSKIEPNSPLAMAVQRVARASDEALTIAKAHPDLMGETKALLNSNKKLFLDLGYFGRGRISAQDLGQIKELLAHYGELGSDDMRQHLTPVRELLDKPNGPAALGLVVWDEEMVLD